MRKVLLLIILSFFSIQLVHAQSNNVAKGWSHPQKKKAKDKWQRKAQKQDHKIKRANKSLVRKQKSKGKLSQKDYWAHDDKVDKLREKEQGMIYKGRSKRHVKVQDKKTKKRMKKALKQHRKLNR